jgi:lipid II:glycine glycyltransferase (peptidoglycan interpeptide bridge formation enzyme)
VNYGNPRSSS